jgi:hypothetical protein
VLVDRKKANYARDGLYLLDLPGLELRGIFRRPDGKVDVIGSEPEMIHSRKEIRLRRDYGNAPGRCLDILGISLLVFAFVYVFAQQRPGSRGGIWAVWDERRIHQDEGSDRPTSLTDGFPSSRLSNTRVGWMCHMASLNILGLALWYSLLSASQIGWQAFNFGIWFTRMQPREYKLRATGWVRVASGFQSLISVYLLALWILTYFGTPFE